MVEIGFKPKDFKDWQKRMGWTNVKTAQELNVSRTSVIKWKREGAPYTIRLACETLEKRKKK